MGFGSAALQQLIEFFEGKGVSLQEPPEFAAFAQVKQKQQQQQQQQDKKKKKRREKVSAINADIEDLDAEVGASEEETEKETEEETAAEDETETEETPAAAESPSLKSKQRKKEKRAAKKQAAAAAAATAGGSAAAGLSLREVTYKQLQQIASTPPLLCACSSSCPPFSIDYLGAAFGLTEPLLRFWSRQGFVAVHLRQQPNDITGEHSCIMLMQQRTIQQRSRDTVVDSSGVFKQKRRQ